MRVGKGGEGGKVGRGGEGKEVRWEGRGGERSGEGKGKVVPANVRDALTPLCKAQH